MFSMEFTICLFINYTYIGRCMHIHRTTFQRNSSLGYHLQRWLYWREHLKYVWNVHCVATNHRWDLHTTETTGNERFPICHGTNYFRFVLTFSLLHVKIAFPFYLFTVCAIIAKNTVLSDFEINYKADVLGRRTRRFGARIFKLFVTIEIGSYAWSQVTIYVAR